MQHLIDIKQKMDEFVTIHPWFGDGKNPSSLTFQDNSGFVGSMRAENRRNGPRTWLRAGGGT